MKKNKISRYIAAVILPLILLAGTAVSLAEEVTYDTVNITGSHIIENNETLKTGRHTFVLTGTDGAPMPEGSSVNVKKVTINSGETFSFGDISFTKPGIYNYVVSREITECKNLEQDDSVYKVIVSVYTDGATAIVFEKIGAEGKPNKIEYTDTYVEPSGADKSKGVRTGDSFQWIIYFGVFAAAIILMLILLRRNRDDDH